MMFLFAVPLHGEFTLASLLLERFPTVLEQPHQINLGEFLLFSTTFEARECQQ
ncbi:MAG: hypothetical protein R3C02_03265 [Planctomycetaceae bacterium]